MYCPSGHCLCRTMQARSRKIWNDLHDAATLETPYHEDTVTQTLALHLNRHHSRENRVHVFDRTIEGKNGSDFIWLFFSHNKMRYFPVAIQAKRLYADGRYRAFKAHQVKKIRNYASVAGALPVYMTYNYPPFLHNCRFLPHFWRSGQPFGRAMSLVWPRRLDYQRDLGLLFFHADQVAKVKDGQLDSIGVAKIGFPMWKPFCNCFLSRLGDPLTDLRDGFAAQSEDADSSTLGLRETPAALRSWITGEAVEERVLEREMRVDETTEDDGFYPSFMIGTIIGSGE